MTWLITCAVLVILWQITSAQVSEHFFRNDYTYSEHTESFYKINRLSKTWYDAAKVCSAEGAELFYPQDVKEAVLVTGLLRSQSYDSVFIGASSILVPGIYETIEGVPVEKLYHKWAVGEPDSDDTACVLLHNDGTLHDENCLTKLPFVCKKTLATLQWNKACNMPDLDYEYNESFNRCYKFHLNPMNWSDAYVACGAEQSYLIVLNSVSEAEYLIDLTKRAPKDNIPGDYLRGTVHVGFHNKRNTGWMTIKGVPLADSGFALWAGGEPNGGANKEQCGSLFYGGGLNDIPCSVVGFFVCEHELN